MSGPDWTKTCATPWCSLVADLDAITRCVAISEVYRLSRDLFLAQRFARHVSPLTTVLYTHEVDEKLFKGTNQLQC